MNNPFYVCLNSNSKNVVKTTPRNNLSQLDCTACGLYKGCQSPKMAPSGEGKLGILVVAEAPGKTEDEKGIQLIGEAGQVLRRAMKEVGLDLDRDCRKTNAVCCRPPKNRVPRPKEINCCRSRLWKEIEEFKPKLIILLGATAARSFLQHRWKKDFPKITALRGWVAPDRDSSCWAAYTFHPSFVLRSEGIPAVEDTFVRDLQLAKRHLDKPFPKPLKDRIELMKNPAKIRRLLLDLMTNAPELTALDYEASGLKLHRKGHFIRTAAIAFRDVEGRDRAFAFPMLDELRQDFARFLCYPNISKVAHNIPYEEMAGRAVLGVRTAGWARDTLLGAHFIDSRNGTSGLKFQTYVQFGIPDYSSHLERFLTSVGEGEDADDGNAMNKVADAPLDELLRYNALDCLHTLRLARRQGKRIPDEPGMGYSLLHDGALALCDVEQNGMRLDIPYCEREEKALTERMAELRKRILGDKNVLAWKERMKAEKKEFNLASDYQLRDTLYTVMKLDHRKLTAHDKPSVDADALKGIAREVPFVRDLLALKAMKKSRDYLRAWTREAVDGVLHPHFSLATVETFRSSCSRPNLQNVPVRNKEIQKLLRTAIIPRPGHQLLEIDFKGIEVAVGACYHKDPTMVAYISDPSKDMHRDMAMEIYRLEVAQVSKEIRHAAKNSFVFPEFYGSYYEQTAPDLWDVIQERKLTLADGTPLSKHLKANGLGSYEKFVAHIKVVEDRFWNEKFPIYTKWKREREKQYLEDGRLELLTGFHCQGPLRRNQILNFPIQGTAFHILLRTLTKLNQAILKRCWDARIVSQIHDSMVIDVKPSELDQVCAKVQQIIAGLPKHWPWIIVPLNVEMELAPVDGSWYEKKEFRWKGTK